MRARAVLSLLASAALALTLGACAGTGTDEASSSSSSSEMTTHAKGGALTSSSWADDASEGKYADSEYVGLWEKVGYSGSESESEAWQTIREQESMLEAFGYGTYVQLKADGTGTYDMLGTVYDATWDPDVATLTVIGGNSEDGSDRVLPIAIQDGQLVVGTAEGIEYYADLFDKASGSDEERVAQKIASDVEETENAAAETTQAIDPVTVVDDDVCTIKVTAKLVDVLGDTGYTIEFTNKTSQTVVVSTDSLRTTIDGEEDSLGLYIEAGPGETVTKDATFLYYDGKDVAGLKNVKVAFEVHTPWNDDGTGYDELGDYEVSMP